MEIKQKNYEKDQGKEAEGIFSLLVHPSFGLVATSYCTQLCVNKDWFDSTKKVDVFVFCDAAGRLVALKATSECKSLLLFDFDFGQSDWGHVSPYKHWGTAKETLTEGSACCVAVKEHKRGGIKEYSKLVNK